MIRTSPARNARAERTRLIGWLVIVAALTARVGWAAWVAHAHPEAVTSPDTPDYLDPARALFDQWDFRLSPQDDTPMFLRTPGYPAFLAAILWVTNSEWSISPVQALLSCAAVVIVVLVGRRVVGATAGILAGLFVAFDPLQFALSGTVLTESLATVLLAAAVAAAVPVFARTPDRVLARHVLLLGLAIAVATMVRPTTYYLPIVVLILFAIRFRHLARRSMIALMLALVLPTVVMVGGWMVRNHDAVDSWQFSGSQAVTLYCWHAAEVEAKADSVEIRDARERLGCEPSGFDPAVLCPSWWACDESRPLTHGPSWDEMNRRGVEILLEHPVESAEVFIRGLAREVAAPGADTVGRFLHTDSSPVLAAVLFSWNLLLWTLALVGAIVGLRSSQRWFWIFVVTVIGYVLVVSAGANAGARFRTPLVPLLALLAALGARFAVQRIRGHAASRRTTTSPSSVDTT